MELFSREEFASRRRATQDAAISELLPVVKDALSRYGEDGWWRSLLGPVRSLFNRILSEDSGGDVKGDVRAWGMLSSILSKTLPQTGAPVAGSAQTIATFLSTSAINAAAESAARHDSEPLLLTWVTMHDSHVRTAHRDTDGQERPPGEPFSVDGVAMPYPGWTGAPIELWVNCRCMVRPMLASESMYSETSTFAPTTDNAKPTGRVIVALPAKDHAVHSVGPEPKHMTMVWLGSPDENPDLDMDAVKGEVAAKAHDMAPFSAQVNTVAPIGSEGAQAWMCGDDGPTQAHDDLLSNPLIGGAYNSIKQFPVFTPHVTIGYDDEPPPEAADINQIPFDRLALWDGENRTEFPLGGTMPTKTSAAADTTTEAPPEPTAPGATSPGLGVPWHGILAPENAWSGDGRRFGENSLRHRDLPLPLSYQKMSDDGHGSAVVVARIEGIERVNGMMCAFGHFLLTPDADEAIGMVADFGKYGVSVDADDAEAEYDENTDKTTFTSARIASACMVAIPAFQEAYMSLGEPPTGFMPSFDLGDGTQQTPETDCDPAAPDYEDCLAQEQSDTPTPKPGQQHALVADRGPGWVTNPEDTKRIHDYWTVPGEPGYEKVAWGTDGDFNRCRVEVGQEIAENSPETTRFLNQICAQWHHDATGFWPGHAPAETALAPTEGTPAPALSLVAANITKVPADWFADPDLGELTPVTVTEDGRVFGHLAGWKSCHGAYGTCVAPPHSASGYAHYLTGQVLTDEGPVAVGHISLGGGHAQHGLRARAAREHYDSTSTVVADVTCGEDDHGIWIAGMIRPGVSDEMVYALRASALSGDWREYGAGNLEMIHALAVNAPGFLVPRVGISNGRQVSLVAAGGFCAPSEPMQMGELDWSAIADRVVAELDARSARKARMSALALQVGAD